jgi:hypothetical protein
MDARYSAKRSNGSAGQREGDGPGTRARHARRLIVAHAPGADRTGNAASELLCVLPAPSGANLHDAHSIREYLARYARNSTAHIVAAWGRARLSRCSRCSRRSCPPARSCPACSTSPASSGYIEDDINQFTQFFDSIASPRKVICFCKVVLDNDTVNTGRHCRVQPSG